MRVETIGDATLYRGDAREIVPGWEFEMNKTPYIPIDDEKTPDTTIFNNIEIGGVTINSRYAKKHEIKTMIDILFNLDEGSVGDIYSIFCDSKFSHSYTIKMRLGMDHADITKPICSAIHLFLMATSMGHNGIRVGETADECPGWFNDE